MFDYANCKNVFIQCVNELSGNVLIAHHGDADGISGAGLLAAYLQQRGCTITFSSSAEFGEKEFFFYRDTVRNCTAGVFIEAQGMPDCYRELDHLFLNIDHHPSPRPPLITRTLNPWLHGITPLPCAAYIIYDLLREQLPPAAGWLAALASMLDYCSDAARELIARERAHLVRFPDLRDTFHAVQYAAPHVCDLAAFVATLPSPDMLLAQEPFATRRTIYRDLLASARDGAELSQTCIVARTVAGDFRLASPLANTLQDEYPGRAIIVIEEQPLLDRARFSVRWRSARRHVGSMLAVLTCELGAGDGTGHAAAGSARVPLAQSDAFLSRLRAAIAGGA